ncbi:MAG: hypothetical protein D6674_04380 [Acidobacteria bacterium]|jgi:hypothetical protein|nr:MAG: hypothetical protein D6674_04380 [Acidobacteriota bacterium]
MSTKEWEEFSELIKFTLMGYVGGLSLGMTLDHLGYQKSALGQWAVRTIFYALSDQTGASLLGLMYMTRREGSFKKGLRAYLKSPVMLTSLGIVLLVPLGLLFARVLGLSPTTQLYTALETVAANLCWLPPLAGFLVEKNQGKGGSP